jgi:serine/threonine protein kinase/Tfp pilus assembly protein PilF
VSSQEDLPNTATSNNSVGLDTTLVAASDETAGTLIGRYRLLEKIGEGGMGEVWLAEQREPVRRRVAVKLVKAGMNTREVIARFESERQALALMDHPAIARVFDAGSTSQGAPYFVMEYVAGIPITAYCDNHRLGTRERLELFIHVCEGVQHAHQKAIIHRDLKPSNILVTEVDGHAVPKIIDFGVAKALTRKLTADTMYTRLGAMIGTPEYMSPEQAKSSGEDIDTRTDVYSLGIIFYELLAGAPPLELRKIALEEFLRRLREEEPPKPSTKIRTQDPATSSDVATKRHTEPPALANQLRGEVDSIALKALEKERSRRYASPSEFAADIRRYLGNEAVLAVPPSLAYRARKFARRNRAGLITASGFVLVLLVATAVSIRQGIRANKEAAIAQAVNDFLQNDLLAQASTSNQSKPDPDLKVRTALDRAAQRIEGKFNKQPEVEASIRSTIGQTYMDMGVYPQAQTQFERALDLDRSVLGEKDPKTLRIMSRLGRLEGLQGQNPQAAALLSQTFETQRRLLGPEHPDTLYTENHLANIYQNEAKYAQAEAIHSHVLEIRRRVLGPEHSDTLNVMNNLAIDYWWQTKYAQAEALLSQAVEIRRRVSGPDHPDTLKPMVNLASVYRLENKYTQAEQLYSQALEIERRVLGPEHPNTLATMQSLAIVYSSEGQYARAELLENQAFEIQRHILGPDHPDTLRTMSQLAAEYGNQGNNEKAEQLLSQTLEIDRRVLGPEHPDTLVTMINVAVANAALGKYAQAEQLCNQAFEAALRKMGPGDRIRVGIASECVGIYQMQRKYAMAEKYAVEALAGRRHALGSQAPETMVAAANLALAYVSQKKFAVAEPLAREAMQTDSKIQPNDWQRFLAESILGASLAGQKKYAEAEPLFVAGYQGMVARKTSIAAPDRYKLELARKWLAQLYEDLGESAKAAQLSTEHKEN